MDYNHHSEPGHTLLNNMLFIFASVTGFISIHFQEYLKDIDLLLSPLVKCISIASFVIYLIINHATIKEKLKTLFK